MGTINEHEDPLATWELTPDDDPVLISHKDTDQPHFCAFLNNPEADTTGRPYAYGLRNDGHVSLAPPQVDIDFSGELRIGNLMHLTQDTCFLKAPLRLTNAGALELGCLDVGPKHFKVSLPSDGNMSVEGGKRVINAPTFVNGTLAIQHQPGLKGTAFDLSPLQGPDALIYAHDGDIQTNRNLIADQGLVRGRRVETVDVFAQAIPAEHKAPVDIDSVFYMLGACTGFTDKRFDTSKYDYPFMGFDANAIATTVPELVRHNDVVSLQGLVALLVNAVNDLHTRVSALENK